MSWGKQKGRNEQSQSIDPRLAAYASQNMGRANELMDQGGALRTPEYYGGDEVADMTQQQRNALDATMARGGAGSGGLGGFVEGQLGQAFDPSGLQRGMDQFTRGAGWGGQSMIDQLGGMGLGEGLGYASTGGSPYDAALMQQAGGAVNPLTSAMFGQAAGDLAEQFNENVLPGIGDQFGAAGRTGSDAHGRALTDAGGELADAQAGLAAQMFGGAAESALGRQLGAAQAGLGDDLSRRGLGAELYSGDANRGLQAAQGLYQGGLSGLGLGSNLYGMQTGNQLRAAGLAPTAQGMDYQNLAMRQGAADRYQQQAQTETDADIAEHQWNSMRGIRDWERQMGALQGLQGIGSQLMGNTRGNSSGKGKSLGNK